MSGFTTHHYGGKATISATAIIKPSSHNCYVTIKAGGDYMTIFFDEKEKFDSFCSFHSIDIDSDYRDQD